MNKLPNLNFNDITLRLDLNYKKIKMMPPLPNTGVNSSVIDKL